ncbi:DUF1467 family protein [Stakelama marina]|uniref:DUF1467 family protein n=1 Tax=Stakelama marina TaxID=2826939 RepID=A0A8T4IAS5_9SPHN|nr:DUF1467 family protein [Stakelama marina]MBR0551481.1 DUF1467 family protein [Stakelama marina]
MAWQSAIAVYFLVWVLCALLVLPFNVRPGEEDHDRVPGQADGAPGQFPARRIAIQTTIVATFVFALFIVNWEYGWVTVEMLDFYN